MAIYHASCKPLGRAQGRSSVAAAAYRSGTNLTDERTGLVHDYTQKSGVVSAEIIAPHGLNFEREALWSAAELAETAKTARTAREWVIALPHELNQDERAAVAREFATSLVERFGVAVDMAIHEPSGKESDSKNHHAHILMTTRVIEPDGSFGEKSYAEWAGDRLKKAGYCTSKDEIKSVRKVWEDIANRGLERAGRPERIDHRSHADRGLLEVPTTHIGYAANAMEKRSEKSDRGDVNRHAAAFNNELKKARAEVISLEAEREKRRLAKAEQEQKNLKNMPVEQLERAIKAAAESKKWCLDTAKALENELFLKAQSREVQLNLLKERADEVAAKRLAEQQAAEKWRREHPIRTWLKWDAPAQASDGKASEYAAQANVLAVEIASRAKAHEAKKRVEQEKVEPRKTELLKHAAEHETTLVTLKAELNERPNDVIQRLREAERERRLEQERRENERARANGRGDDFDFGR